MDIFGILMFIGGLALSLYGMNVMSSGLERLSGGQLEKVLEKATNSRIKGLFLGMGVTALIQSSSATTVMAVGFVNSGIMKLRQAVGIIMGANIGTTITAWILSLAGIEGGAWYVNIFKPTSFSPLLALIGIILILFVKNQRQKEVGHILLGFAVLMFGMDTMGNAVEPLAESESFKNVLLLFENPILGLLAGAVLTGIIQSSAAGLGMVQALCVTGAITYGSAIPIVLGMNIGTCVTALISCIGANKNARRTAMVHLYFNIIGSVVFMILFYVLNAIFKWEFVSQPVNAAHIAIIHTVFNVLATVAMYPMANILVKLAEFTVRDKSEKAEHTTLLDERFLETPSFALAQTKTVTDKMAELARTMFMTAIDMVYSYTPQKAAELDEYESHMDKYEDKIGSYLVNLSAHKMDEKDSREVGKLLHVIGDFERIGDHALNIVETAKEIYDKKIKFSDQAKSEMAVFERALKDIVNNAIDSFINDDITQAAGIEPLEQVIDMLENEIKGRHIARVQEGNCTIELGFVYNDLLHNMERVSDHCSNVAVSVIQMHEPRMNAHYYLNAMKEDKSSRYIEEVERLKNEYAL